MKRSGTYRRGRCIAGLVLAGACALSLASTPAHAKGPRRSRVVTRWKTRAPATDWVARVPSSRIVRAFGPGVQSVCIVREAREVEALDGLRVHVRSVLDAKGLTAETTMLSARLSTGADIRNAIGRCRAFQADKLVLLRHFKHKKDGHYVTVSVREMTGWFVGGAMFDMAGAPGAPAVHQAQETSDVADVGGGLSAETRRVIRRANERAENQR